MKKVGILRRTLPMLAIAAFFLAGCHSATQLLPDHPRRFPGVTIEDLTFHSVALNLEMPYRVYRPAQLAADRKLPVVYLLHGCGGSFQNWSNYSDVGHYAAGGQSPGLILVMAEGGCSYYTNAALKPADRYEDYLVNDLIADVESRLPAAKGRENRAVVGVSMGGLAAVKLALSHPDLFAFAGAVSPAIDVPSRRFSFRRWGQSLRFRAIFGPDGSPTRRSCDPFILVQSANPSLTPTIFLTAGEHEPLLEPIKRFRTRLHERGFAYEFHTKPGGHDWNEWDAQIPACFDNLMKHLRQSR